MPREYTPATDCTNQQRLPIPLQPVTSNQIMADSLGRHFGEHISKLPSKKFAPDGVAVAA